MPASASADNTRSGAAALTWQTGTMTESPETRIGTAERNDADSMLRQHLLAGRLTEGEYETRAEAARGAWTQHDLNVIFADLPDPKPSQQLSGWEQPDFSHQTVVDPRVSDPMPVPTQPTYPAVPTRHNFAWIGPVLFAAAIMLLIVTGMFSRMWWVVFPLLFVFKWSFPHGFGDRRRGRRG